MKKFFVLLMLAALSVCVNAQLPEVWDLGAEQLEGVKNMLSESEINSWFPDAEPGSTGVTVSNIVASDSCNFRFNGAGKSNHRLRSTNTNLTRYDDKSLKDADGNVYSGYIYSNAGSNTDVYIEQSYTAGDKVEFFVGSNGGVETYVLESPSGVKVEGEFTNAAKIEKLTFYIGEDGKHKLYGTNEKLVVARIVRTQAQKGGFSGSVTAPKSIPDNYELVFTNTTTGQAESVKPNLDQYEITGLSLGYEYEVSLANANGYVVTSENPVALKETSQKLDIVISSVSLCTMSGKILGLPAEQLKVVDFEFVVPKEKIYVPEYTLNRETGEYSLVLEVGVEYGVNILNINDYECQYSQIKSDLSAEGVDIKFSLKPRYVVTIEPTGLTLDDLAQSVFTFTNLDEEGYVYTFTGPNEILLRDGVYSVVVSALPADFNQLLTSNLIVNGQDVKKIIDFESNVINVPMYYVENVYVVPDPQNAIEFASINHALAAIRTMQREAGQRVTINITPGNYEEMLKIDVADITLRNASATPSNELKNGGVDIDENAVRITSYYGHGYNYASMGKDYMWDARTLQVNKENGYPSIVNQGGSSTTYWNSTVIVSAKNFEAYDIIFENSYNQYISKKESEDVVYEIEGAGKGTRPTDAGNTDVQKRSFRERACAIAFTKTSDRAYLENCRVVGRQDAIYGDQGARVAVQGGVLMGACDYIFGGMTLICNKTELAMLVSDDKNDVAYLTAAKQDAGVRGYLFNECHVTSARPGIDMVETAYAKPGYWGRPWSANAETVFFNTIVDDCQNTSYSGSLIVGEGWNNGLTASGSPRSYEYGTQESVDNSAKRVSWATVLTDSVLPDQTEITLLNFTKGNDGWNPFNEVISSVPVVKSAALGVDVYATDGELLVSCGESRGVDMSVYDVSGRELLSRRVSGDMSFVLRHGAYVVRLSSGGVSESVKIVL